MSWKKLASALVIAVLAGGLLGTLALVVFYS